MSTATVPLAAVRPNVVALRGVQRDTEAFVGLRDSVAQIGILNPINVREKTDEDTGEAYYELVDGLHRYTAAQDAGLSEIPVNVVDLNESQVLEAQIMANVHKVETRPVEYTKQLQRILTANPTMTMSELAGRLAKTPQWLSQRFGLLKLHDEVQGLVNDGKIKLANAYQLAKLPPEEQLNYIDAAMTQQPDEFIPSVTKRAKEIREARRAGKDESESGFSPNPHLRKASELKAEFTSATVGPALCDSDEEAAGFALGIAWALHMDADSVDAQKAAYEKRVAERAEASEKRKLERLEKKEKEAAEALVAAKEAAGVA